MTARRRHSWARDGSVDWLCLPNFDSGACFAALLGTPENGRWLLAPVGKVSRTPRRRYRGDTLILETYYETDDGAVTLVDCMPPRSKEPDLVRVVMGQRGTVPMRMELIIRFDYGWVVPWVQRIDGGILRRRRARYAASCTPRLPLTGKDLTTTSEFSVSAGESVPFVLMWHRLALEATPAPSTPQEAIGFTEDWWQDWSSRCTHEGEWREAVMRSLITLKALTFAPTGGIVAAATTSLPEQLGGVRNWDYRYCWLRDATFTLYSLACTGYSEEACRVPRLAVAGRGRRPVQLADHVQPGRRAPAHGARATLAAWVRELAAGAHGQCRLGAVSARRVWRSAGLAARLRAGRHLARRRCAGDFERGLARDFWSTPGGSPTRAFGKCAARGGTSRTRRSWPGSPSTGPSRPSKCRAVKDRSNSWRSAARRIHAESLFDAVSTPSWARSCSTYGSDLLDASLLMMPLVGFLPADDPRIGERSTRSNSISLTMVSCTATRRESAGRWPAPGRGDLLALHVLDGR